MYTNELRITKKLKAVYDFTSIQINSEVQNALKEFIYGEIFNCLFLHFSPTRLLSSPFHHNSS